jgi:hypothetical protein
MLDDSFNPVEPKTVAVRAKEIASVNESNIVFTEAFVRNSLEEVVAEGVIVPNELPFNTTMLLTVHLNSTFASGMYTIALFTENKIHFPFNLFEVA